MKTPSFRASFEGLEVREVLSAVLLAHGTGTLVSRTPIQTGSYELTTDLQGTSRVFGAFTGVVVADLGINQLTVTQGNVTLTDSVGDVIHADLTGSYRIVKPGVTHEQAVLNYTVTSGTGAFANISDTGQLAISQNVENNHLRFTILSAAR